MRTARRVFWNTTVLLGADVARLALGVVLAAVIARHLGSAALGTFTYVFALVGMLGVIGDLGLSAFYVREASRERSPSLVGSFVWARAAGGMLTAGALAVYAAMVRDDPTLSTLLLFGSLLLALGIWPSILTAVLRSQELMVYEGTTKLAGAGATVIGGAAMVLAGRGIVGVAAVMVGVAAATLAYYVWLAARFLPRPLPLRQPVAAYARVLRGAWPFASLAILVVVYFRIDSLMLYALRGREALGQYGAAYRLMEAALLIPLTLAGTALPAVARLLSARAQEVIAASRRAIHFLAILAVPGAVFGALLAPQLFRALYGPGFEEGARIFQVLVFTLVPVFASSVTSSLISAGPRPMINTYIAAVMVALNVTLNLALIPRWSGTGAATATVITEATGLILGTLYIQKAIAPMGFAGEFLKPALASLAGGIPAVLVPSLAVLPLCGGGYLAVLWLLGGVTHEDVSFLRRLVLRPKAALLPGGEL